MSLTAEEILKKKMPNQFQTLGVIIDNVSLIELIEAMQEYAEQEAKSYANWLANQVIAGRTSTKLWRDYKTEFPD